MIALKLPLGLSVLVLIGLFVFFKRRLPPGSHLGFAIVLAAALLFLLVLALGSTYAGIRHALPVVVLLAIFGGCAIQTAFSSRSMLLRFVVAAALGVAVISAVPAMRPWEYFNEIIGGTKNGPRYFSDEGVDLFQRGRELASYYHQVLEAAGEVPLLNYAINEPEEKARHLDWIGRDKQRDQGRLTSPVFSGTILVNAKFLGKRPFWDLPDLRRTPPTARFGNLLVFRGTFNCSGILAPNLYIDALSKIYAEKPDLEEAERLLRQSVQLDPNEFFANISLGNVCVKRGSRESALHAYSDALRHAPNDPELVRSIQEQIRRVSSEPLGQVPELRDPFME